MSHSQHEAPAARDITAAAGKLGRDAGKAAASWTFDGSTPEGTYRRVLRGIEDGDPADHGRLLRPSACPPRRATPKPASRMTSNWTPATRPWRAPSPRT